MADPRSATILVRPQVGTPEPGFWCARCLLPSRVRFPLSAILPDQVTSLGSVLWCPDCETAAQVCDQWRAEFDRR
ncbi:hypothetical protein IU501_34680 [Nocardia otitidiscaviarum]|uniref:hypothetical protein n=1 Tax=Nocardia otitidiscaviarum TaxID=1823 RepID=UPI0018934CFE|nr:hypothetical protein [Nocardia otitidiscaviarum]MBF6138117.1 hypothetical protein [Nocardia otitidiscaviarum]